MRKCCCATHCHVIAYRDALLCVSAYVYTATGPAITFTSTALGGFGGVYHQRLTSHATLDALPDTQWTTAVTAVDTRLEAHNKDGSRVTTNVNIIQGM
jgi:hypothetical protein